MTENRAYKRSLGLFELVSLGVGGTIGSGIFVVPGLAAGLSGPWSLLAWAIVAISASCVILSLASISSRFASAGSFYSLFESVFGSKIAVPLIFLYIISSIFGVSTIAAGIGQYIGFFDLSHILLIEIALITSFCLINIIGISLSGMTENVLTTIKICTSCRDLAPARTLHTAGKFYQYPPPDCLRAARNHHHRLLAVHRF